MFTDRLFTGQRQLADLGIYQFGARFYSPKLGRFLSADSIVPQPFNPQSLNRYSYGLNNPVRYTDPTGHMVASDIQGGDSCYICAYPSTSDGGGGGGSTGGGSSTTGGTSAGETTETSAALNPIANPADGLLPPSPFACSWIDCILSGASLILSVGTFPGVPPEISIPAFFVDVGVTTVAYFRTEDAYLRGEITNVNRLALNITGIGGAIPGRFGIALSLGNFLFTMTGYPR